MDIDPIRTAARRVRKEDRLGKGAACVLCHESDSECLTLVPASTLQEHHVLGRNYDPDATVTVCFNCHHRQHERLMRAGVDLTDQVGGLTRFIHVHRSLAVLFASLAESHERCASDLEDFAEERGEFDEDEPMPVDTPEQRKAWVEDAQHCWDAWQDLVE